MTLNQLYYFITVAKLQHFRQAAEELNISQPSLSYSMSTLEKELGTVLFEKQGRNIHLTKYGYIFLDYVKKSIEYLELGEKKIKKLTDSKSGNIDIAYVASLAPYYIPKTVRNFLDNEDNKNITFTFKQGFSQEIVDGLKSSKFDIGFCSLIPNEPAIEFIPILEQELIVIVNKSHPLANTDSINLTDIAEYPLISYTANSGLGHHLANIFKKNEITPNIIFEGDDELSISGLVEQNFGIAIVAKTPQLSSFNLKEIKINNLDEIRYIYLAYAKDRYLTPATTKFINYIKNSNFK